MIKTFSPHFLLRPYIKSYNYIRINAQNYTAPMKFLPMGNPVLVFNQGPPYFVKNDVYHEVIRNGDSLVIGQQDRYYLLKPEEDLFIFMIIFQPTGVYRLLNYPIHEIGNKSIRLIELPDPDLRSLPDYLKDKAANIESFVNTAEQFFLHRLKSVQKKSLYIEDALHSIFRCKGFLSVKQLSSEANTSERNFRRRFFETVGIAPKKYILINRLHYILHMMEQKPAKINWADIAYSCGYYDQMHFIKEFKKFSGETPSHYYKEKHQIKELYSVLFNKEV